MKLTASEEREQGFMLVGLIVAIFLILLALSVAAPRVARDLRREREVETVRRGNQYVRAIQVYYRKLGHYPGSMEQLEKTNNMRFLRQKYVDPMTGKADWRLIKVGEAKTTVKGFFGKPLTGLAPGLGTAASMSSAGGIGAGAAGGAGTPGPSTSAFGGGSSIGSPLGGSGLGGSSGSGMGSTALGSSGVGSSGAGSTVGAGSDASSGAGGAAATTGSSYASSSGFGSSSGIGSQSATGLTGAEGPCVGVGLVKDGDSIITLNEQTTYPTWEFIYDPRIEQLKAAAALLGGANSTNSSGFGAGSAPSAGPGTGFGSPTTTSPASPTTTSPMGGSTGPATTPPQ
jgi:type II secretory pathway pseudopilin PulG